MPLADVTFVVVDLETTGSQPSLDAITEIGAVKVQGGEVLGEFSTLVNPERSIPLQVTHLTGITSQLVCDAPQIQAVLPHFLDFLPPHAVLVAHNARFDVGFLKAAACAHGFEFQPAHILDTVLLARGLVPHDEAPNHKLGTLAELFNASTTPNHRALADAQATVDVLHALIGRAGSLGVLTLEDLLAFSGKVPARRRRKSSLTDDLPHAPGVYVFKDAGGEVLYVGASHDIKQRVKSYFTGGELRPRMGEMVNLACAVTPLPYPTALEAQVRKVRVLAAHRPPYNKKSEHPKKTAWLKLTQEPSPRLAIVWKQTNDGGLYVGPFPTKAAAERVRDAIHSVRRIRRCPISITVRPQGRVSDVPGVGCCETPCVGNLSPEASSAVVATLRTELSHDCNALIADLETRMDHLRKAERFEEARWARDGLLALLESLDRSQRQTPLLAADIFIAGRLRAVGGWEFGAISRGHLMGTAVSERGIDPRPVITSLRAKSDTSEPLRQPLAEETDLLLAWLERPGTRIVESSHPWYTQRASATPHLHRLAPEQGAASIHPAE